MDIRNILVDAPGDPQRPESEIDAGSVIEPRALEESGLLLRKVYHSPIIKWIFPARIRSDRKNDVVFIGEDLLQLKEWDPSRRSLCDIACEADFGSKIISAAVLGERKTSGEHTRTAEAMESMLGSRDFLPPQVLILFLQSQEVMLVVADESSDESVRFITHRRPLPALTLLRQPGRHIATEPKSRAIALAASDRTLVIYGLAADNFGRPELLKDLVVQELILRTDVIIVKMEFLYPSGSDPDTATLIVLGMTDERLRTLVYSWDVRGVLQPSSIQTNIQTVGKEHSIPMQLIPLRVPGYFVLVCEQTIAVNLVSPYGSVEQTHSLPLYNDSNNRSFRDEHVGISRGLPLGTNWARPTRNSWNEWPHEMVYLSREDGVIRYVQIGGPTAKLVIENQGSVGELGCNIDSAFAVLDIEQPRIDDLDASTKEAEDPKRYRRGYPDAIVTAGNLSDGGLFEIGFVGRNRYLSRAALHEPQRREPFYNWAPFSSVVSIKSRMALRPATMFHGGPSGAPTLSDRERLFATCGKVPYGAITELRYGIEICLQPVYADSNFHLAGVNDIWIAETGNGTAFVVVSYPWGSAALVYHEPLGIFYPTQAFECEESTLAFDKLYLGSEKFSAEEMDTDSSPREVLAQVNRSQIHLWEFNDPTEGPQISCVWKLERTTHASIEPTTGLILTVSRTDSGTLVALYRIVSLDGILEIASVGKPLTLTADVSCATFVNASAIPDKAPRDDAAATNLYAAIGTGDGTIILVAIENGLGLRECWRHELLGDRTGFPDALESIAALKISSSPDSRLLLLCGSRQGKLHTFQLNNEMVSARLSVTKLVSTTYFFQAIRIVPDYTNAECAIVYSGSYVCYFNYHDRDIEQSRICEAFFVDPQDRSFAHGAIDALCFASPVSNTTGFAGRCIGSAEGRLMVGQIRFQDPRPVPTRIMVPGTPHKIIYSSHLHSLIFSSNVLYVDEQARKRFPISTVCIMDPRHFKGDFRPFAEGQGSDFVQSSFKLDPAEKICDLVEWFCESGGRLHHFIVAATSNTGQDGDRTGSIRYLKVNAHGDGNREIYSSQRSSENYPVFAICKYGQASLIYCCGNELRMRTFDPDSRRFDKRLLHRLPSPGRHVTTERNLVCVTTDLHSFRVYGFDDDDNLALFLSASKPTPGISHLTVPGTELGIFTARGGFIAGMHQIPYPVEDVGRESIFEGKLSSSIVQLVSTKVRPPWKRDKIKGVLERDLLGIATDGSLFAINVVTDQLYRLLRFVANMCVQDERICPARGSIARNILPAGPGEPEAKDRQVEGDVLARLVEQPNAEDLLRSMLAAGKLKDVAHGGVDMPDAAHEREATFNRLARSATLDEMTVWSNDAPEHADQDWVGRSLLLMRTVLELPL